MRKFPQLGRVRTPEARLMEIKMKLAFFYWEGTAILTPRGYVWSANYDKFDRHIDEGNYEKIQSKFDPEK